jgi:RimJ/RimL family protein N-acetyltransferase
MIVSLRTAALADCERVWQWNFAADVRALSNDPTIVALETHTAWYMNRVAKGAIWIVQCEGVDVGVVRIDAGQISIALAAGARGRGVGKRAIAAACAAWGGPVVAQIRNDNQPSRAAFEACGFVSNGRETYEWRP